MLYDDAVFEPKADGAIIIEGREVAHTRQCCHCGGHFISRRGSGAIRGWCLHCNAVTCGSPQCNPCVPMEKMLAKLENAVKS